MNIIKFMLAIVILVDMTSATAKAESTPTGLPIIRMQPKIVVTPNNTQPTQISSEGLPLIRQLLTKGDRILAENVPAPGHILGAVTGQQTFSKGDMVVIFYPTQLAIGSTLDIFRPKSPLRDPVSQEILGFLSLRLGSVQIKENTSKGVMALITTSFHAIEPGDQLALPTPINRDFTINTQAQHPVSGRVIKIQDDLEEAASHTVIIVSLGRKDRVFQGLTLPIYRSQPAMADPVTGKSVATPPQRIGQAILYQIGSKASFAMLEHSVMPIHLGDTVRTP